MPLPLPSLRRSVGCAFGLVALPLVVGVAATRLLTSRAEREHPPLGRFVTVDGLRQHVIERGEGPPILFVHGAFCAGDDFVHTVFDELEGEARCIAWDRPGHGWSERPTDLCGPEEQGRLLGALVRELGLERPLLVGFSLGGAVVLQAAAEDPSRYAGAVLLNAPAYTWTEPTELHYRVPEWPVVGTLFTETIAMPFGLATKAGGIERVFAPDPVAPLFERSPLSLALRPASYRANAQDVRELKPFLARAAERWRGLTLPLVIVQSRDDKIVSPTLHAPRLVREAPDAELTFLEHAGHQIPYSHTAEVLAAVRRGLARR